MSNFTRTLSLDTGGQTRMAPGACPACGHARPVRFLWGYDRFHGRDRTYHLVRCPSCSLVWLEDPPLPSEMGQHYGADYDGAIPGPGGDPKHWMGRRDTLLRY